jgi:haloalkane dehalogenase
MTEVHRTPDECFKDLPGYDFEPRYMNVPNFDDPRDVLRLHYVDEGPIHGPVVLLLHGEPSWSYLYRKMIPPLVKNGGFRVVAPDLIGFGKSDKPAAQSAYTFARHCQWIRAVIAHLELSGITLFCQVRA